MKTLLVCSLFVCPLLAQPPLPTGDSVTPGASLLAAHRLLPPQDLRGVRPVPYPLPHEIREAPRGRGLFAASVAALAAANAADLATSWGRNEANPFLASSNARFGPQSAALKAGFTGVSLVIQWFALRHNPRLHRGLAYTNFAVAGGISAVAIRNTSVPR